MKEVRRMQEKMEYALETTVKRVDELMEVRDVEFPQYDEKIQNLHKRLAKSNALIIQKVTEDRNFATKKLSLKILSDYAVKRKK